MARAFSAHGWPLLSVHLAPFSNVSSPGFQKEADSLLSVTKLSIISDSQNMGKARDILLKLSEETNIFPTSWQLSERYLFVVVSSSECASLPATPALKMGSCTGEQVDGRKFKYLVASGASPADVAPVAPWRRVVAPSTCSQRCCAVGCSRSLLMRWEKIRAHAWLNLRATEGGPQPGSSH